MNPSHGEDYRPYEASSYALAAERTPQDARSLSLLESEQWKLGELLASAYREGVDFGIRVCEGAEDPVAPVEIYNTGLTDGFDAGYDQGYERAIQNVKKLAVE